MTNVFHKSTWARVRPGDTVLMAWESLGEIVEIRIAEAARRSPNYVDLKERVTVSFDFVGDHFELSFDSDQTVYVQSRL